MVDDQMLISELAERAGVSVRTIRFYINEGLLPAPQGRGRYSVYDEEYLTRIELIKLLKSAYLPLKEIKRMVESLSKDEIEHMLRQLSEPASPLPSAAPQAPTSAAQPAPTGTRAAAKSAGLLPPGKTGVLLPNNPGVVPPDRPGVIPPNNLGVVKESGLPEALNYITRVLHSQAAPSVQRAPASPPMPGRPAARARASLDQADVDAGAGAAQAEESESSWRRYTIQPGVELLVSEQVYTQSAPSIHRIVAQVKQLFSSHPSGGKNV
jgi:DNA-binding transcriptional MerR regulator